MPNPPPIVSVHYYDLAPTRNKGVYALSVRCLVLLMQPSSHCASPHSERHSFIMTDYLDPFMTL